MTKLYFHISATLIMTMLIALGFLPSRTSVSAELSIDIYTCRNPASLAYLEELKVLKDSSVYRILKPQHERRQVLKNLGAGTYTLEYISLFNKQEQIKIDIKESKVYAAKVCLDFLDYSKETYRPIIDCLKDGEKLDIYMFSQGCFHSTKDTLMINRSKSTYVIHWGPLIKILTPADLEDIRHFEMELNYMEDDGCTTTDSYVLKHQDSVKIIEDGSCRWNGDYYLKRRIFGMSTRPNH